MAATIIETDSRVPPYVGSVANWSKRSLPSTSCRNVKLSGASNHQEKQATILSRSSGVDATEEVLEQHLPKPTLFNLLAFAALCLSIFLVALDTVLIPTALPTIATSFHIPDALYAWVGSAYLLANAASVPFWGKISDIFGRKPIILIADAVFLVGSILCGISGNAATLVTGRVIQGLGGGGVVVLVHICVSDTFGIRDRSFYIGTVGFIWACASALGPVIGGIFAQFAGWRWCFFVNIPIICTSLFTLYMCLDLHNPRTPLLAGLWSLDWLGASTVLTAAILLLVGLQLGCTSSFTRPGVVVLILLGGLMTLVFSITQWWTEKNGRSPILPLRIFKDISNMSALSVCACDALAFNSVAYFLPIHFQIVLNLSPSATGIHMLAIAIPLATVSLASGYVIEKTGRFLEILQAGLLTMTIGIGLLVSLDVTHSMGKIIAILVVIGFGFGPNFGAPLIALQTRVRDSDIATGTSAFGFVRMISGAIGVVVGQVVFQMMMSKRFNGLISAGIPEDLAHRLASGEALSLAPIVARLPDQQKLVVKNELSSALSSTWIFYAVVSALGLFVSFGIKRTKLRRESECATELESVRSEVVCGK
ncbi:MFS general substrate transporter [Ophiobolus disseminans]|uniref:MFS general substrate transporter n=1 Tax=Ophiobolus disseminans TaxID=1469910 RepID=A0A6A7AJ66_9PLEO|nr:MFS general substrate transporter [Ophiobolus disseminans]